MRIDRNGLRCPRCGKDTTKVTMTSSYPNVIYRLRKCQTCGRIFKTEEIEVDAGMEKNAAEKLGKLVEKVDAILGKIEKNN